MRLNERVLLPAKGIDEGLWVRKEDRSAGVDRECCLRVQGEQNRLEDKLTATTLMKKLFCLALVAVAAMLVGCNKPADPGAPAPTNAPAK